MSLFFFTPFALQLIDMVICRHGNSMFRQKRESLQSYCLTQQNIQLMTTHTEFHANRFAKWCFSQRLEARLNLTLTETSGHLQRRYSIVHTRVPFVHRHILLSKHRLLGAQTYAWMHRCADLNALIHARARSSKTSIIIPPDSCFPVNNVASVGTS